MPLPQVRAFIFIYLPRQPCNPDLSEPTALRPTFSDSMLFPGSIVNYYYNYHITNKGIYQEIFNYTYISNANY